MPPVPTVIVAPVSPVDQVYIPPAPLAVKTTVEGLQSCAVGEVITGFAGVDKTVTVTASLRVEVPQAFVSSTV